MYYKNFSLTFFSLVVFTICNVAIAGPVSESECMNADWRAIGIKDGIEGIPPSQIESYQATCSQYNILPDITGYNEGHSLGLLKKYCERLSDEERTSSSVCPSSFENDSLTGYKIVTADDIETMLSDLNTEISELNKKISSINKKIMHSTRELRTKQRRWDTQVQGVDDGRPKVSIDEIMELESQISVLNAEEKNLKQQKGFKEEKYDYLNEMKMKI